MNAALPTFLQIEPIGRCNLHESCAALPAIRVVMVLMRANLHQLDAMVRLAHGAGADALFVQRLCHDFGEPGLPAHYRPMRAFIDAQALTEDDADHMAAAFAAARDSAAQLGFEAVCRSCALYRGLF